MRDRLTMPETGNPAYHDHNLNSSEGESSPELSIVIVNWNSAEYVKKCLVALDAAELPAHTQILVVDGGSFDTCASMIATEYADVEFVQAADNIGFGRSNNLGVEQARGKMLLLLNPDTEVDEKAIKFMLDAFSTLPNPGILGPRLLNSDGSLQTSSVAALPTPLNQLLDSDVLRRKFPRSSLWKTYQAYNSYDSVPVEAVSGACMLLETETFRLLGGFSPNYFMYAEDMDLCAKSLEAGYTNYHVPSSFVVHHGGGSSSQQFSKFSEIMKRDALYMYMQLHGSFVSSFAYRAFQGISGIIRMALAGPLFLLTRDVSNKSSFRKWFSITKWAFGLERWASRLRKKHTKGPETTSVSRL